MEKAKLLTKAYTNTLEEIANNMRPVYESLFLSGKDAKIVLSDKLSRLLQKLFENDEYDFDCSCIRDIISQNLDYCIYNSSLDDCLFAADIIQQAFYNCDFDIDIRDDDLPFEVYFAILGNRESFLQKYPVSTIV